MARKVFVSYKFSEAVKTRDKIIKALGDDATYYKGEQGFLPLNLADSTLKAYFGGKIFESTVTIVVISPNVKYSQWVNWEIRYSLEQHTRKDRTSGRNGIVCVIQSKEEFQLTSTHQLIITETSNWAYRGIAGIKVLNGNVFPELITRNMKETFLNFGFFNFYQNGGENTNEENDYCIVVAESTFLRNPIKYIEAAYERSRNFNDYDVETR